MTAKDLLTEIYISDEIAEVIQRLRPESLQEDIKQHVFMELYGMEPAFIEDLNSRGKLKHFIVKMIYNTARWTKSSFKKQFGPMEVPTECFTEVADTVPEEVDIPIDSLYWYKAEILKLYAKHGTYQKVAEITQINISSIFQTVKKAREEIKKKIA